MEKINIVLEKMNNLLEQWDKNLLYRAVDDSWRVSGIEKFLHKNISEKQKRDIKVDIIRELKNPTPNIIKIVTNIFGRGIFDPNKIQERDLEKVKDEFTDHLTKWYKELITKSKWRK